MIGLIAEWHRKRELKKYFVVRFFRERHEIYLRVLAIVGEVDGATITGLAIYESLLQAPSKMQVDHPLAARMLQALRIDRLIEPVNAGAPSADPKLLGALHGRYRLTRQGRWVLDEWWVRRTLQRMSGTASSVTLLQP